LYMTPYTDVSEERGGSIFSCSHCPEAGDILYLQNVCKFSTILQGIRKIKIGVGIGLGLPLLLGPRRKYLGYDQLVV
jgi:hypothetical protein